MADHPGCREFCGIHGIRDEDAYLFRQFFEEEDTAEPSKLEKKLSSAFGEKAESVMMGGTVLLSVVLAVAIFMLLPFWIASLLEKVISSNTVLTLIEGLIRIVIFVGYVLAISMMKDIKRVFMYHGAEHKSINCIENGLPLTVENVKKQSTRHKRCGTSFMLFVVIVSAIFFMFIRVDNMWMRMLYRILLIPVIAGVSYEFIKLAGRSESPVVAALSKPGLWLQGLTTREPDKEMIEVAIQSVEAVFDWKAFLAENKQSAKTEKEKTEKEQQAEQRVEQLKAKDSVPKKAATKKAAAAEKSVKAETAVTEEEPKKTAKAEKTTNTAKTVKADRTEKPAEPEKTETEQQAEQRVAQLKAKASAPIEKEAVGVEAVEDEDDDILNALDRFFTYKKEEAAGERK